MAFYCLGLLHEPYLLDKHHFMGNRITIHTPQPHTSMAAIQARSFLIALGYRLRSSHRRKPCFRPCWIFCWFDRRFMAQAILQQSDGISPSDIIAIGIRLKLVRKHIQSLSRVRRRLQLLLAHVHPPDDMPTACSTSSQTITSNSSRTYSLVCPLLDDAMSLVVANPHTQPTTRICADLGTIGRPMDTP